MGMKTCDLITQGNDECRSLWDIDTLSKVWSRGWTCTRKSQPNLNQINIALVKSLIFIFEDFSPEQY